MKRTSGIAAILAMIAAIVLSIGDNDTEQAADLPTYPPADNGGTYPMTTTWAMTALDEALDILPPLSAAGILAANGWDCLPYPERRAAWSWTPPTTGAPVDHYLVEFTFSTKDTAFDFWIAGTDTQWVRVAGVDSLGRQGSWSEFGIWP